MHLAGNCPSCHCTRGSLKRDSSLACASGDLVLTYPAGFQSLERILISEPVGSRWRAGVVAGAGAVSRCGLMSGLWVGGEWEG